MLTFYTIMEYNVTKVERNVSEKENKRKGTARRKNGIRRG